MGVTAGPITARSAMGAASHPEAAVGVASRLRLVRARPAVGRITSSPSAGASVTPLRVGLRLESHRRISTRSVAIILLATDAQLDAAVALEYAVNVVQLVDIVVKYPTTPSQRQTFYFFLDR